VCGKRGLYAAIMHAQVVYAESVLKVSQFPASLLSIHHWERIQIQAQLVMIIWIPNLITDLMMIDGMMMNEARKTRSLLTIPVNITSVKVPMMLTKIIGMMI
jgi:hypothetical protein